MNPLPLFQPYDAGSNLDASLLLKGVRMNLVKNAITVALVAGVISLTPVAANAYPSATGSVGHETVEVKTSKTGDKVLAVTGVAEFNGNTLAKKTLSITLKLPDGTKVDLGTVKTDANGNYSLNIKSLTKKPGVYKVYATYKGKSTIVTITVK